MIHIFKIKKFKLNFKFSRVEVNTPPLTQPKELYAKRESTYKIPDIST